MSSFFCLTKEKSDDPVIKNKRSSIYDSVFTYNTEKQFKNNYNAFPLLENDIELVQAPSTVFKFIEYFYLILSSIFVFFTLPFSLFFSIKFVNSFERLIIMRLGRAQKVHGPGTVFVFPFIEKAIRIDVRAISVEIPSFQILTNDRGLVEISVVVFFKVFDPMAAYCGVQNRDQTIQSLSYNIIHKCLLKKMLCDLTDPIRLAEILEKSQYDLNELCKSMGTEVTQVKVTQMKIIKQGENQALSLFNTIMKSDMGVQLLSLFGPQIKSFLEENFKVDTNLNTNISDSIKKEKPHIFNNTEAVTNRDSDLDELLHRIQTCCDEQLVNKVKKYYRIKCVNNDGLIIGEFDLNLRDGKGWCDWSDNVLNPIDADVVFALQKETLFLIINNTISPLSAYLNGSVVLSGSVSDAFPLKYLAERAKRV